MELQTRKHFLWFSIVTQMQCFREPEPQVDARKNFFFVFSQTQCALFQENDQDLISPDHLFQFQYTSDSLKTDN